ncbi:helix-turn-helix domain-containing protein [Micromonospora sp. NPDC004704]
MPLKALYRVADAMALLSMSRTVIYQEMRAGRLRYVRQGADRRIPATAITEYVALLERETAQGVAA